MSSTPLQKPPVLARVATFLVWISGLVLIIMAFVITIEALMRKFLGHSFGGVDEITSYVFAVTSTIAFSYAVFERANIRIDVIRDRFGPRIRFALDIIAWASFVFVFIMISYRATELAWQSYSDGARSITPLRSWLFIPQGLWALGLMMTCIAALSLGWRVLSAWRKGQKQVAEKILAPTSEVEIELAEISVKTKKSGNEE